MQNQELPEAAGVRLAAEAEFPEAEGAQLGEAALLAAEVLLP